MSVLRMLAPALLLAGCSGGGAPAGNSEAGPAEVPPATAVQPASGGAPAATGSGLTAQVSNLSADTSGLNMRVTGTGTIIDLPADALFDFDKATLTPAAEVELLKAAGVIRQSPATGTIAIVGHSDAKGDDAYNQRLSEARAQAVADWFGRQVGVRQRSFTVSGRGEAEPGAPNAGPDGSDDPEGRAKNRRVEVVIPRG